MHSHRRSARIWWNWLAILALLLQPFAPLAARANGSIADALLHAYCSSGSTAQAGTASERSMPVVPGELGHECPCCYAGGCTPSVLPLAILPGFAFGPVVASAPPVRVVQPDPRVTWLSLHERGPPAA
jgi:hypothetical protein